MYFVCWRRCGADMWSAACAGRQQRLRLTNVCCPAPALSVWRLYDRQENPGWPAWYSVDYDDSSWTTGRGLFGYVCYAARRSGCVTSGSLTPRLCVCMCVCLYVCMRTRVCVLQGEDNIRTVSRNQGTMYLRTTVEMPEERQWENTKFEMVCDDGCTIVSGGVCVSLLCCLLLRLLCTLMCQSAR